MDDKEKIDKPDKNVNKANLAKYKKYKTELSLDLGRRENAPPLTKRQSMGLIKQKAVNSSTDGLLDGSQSRPQISTTNHRPKPPPLKRQESTLSRGYKQTKALVRRKTEVLVHGSTVDGDGKEEEKFRQLTLRRMQTRGRLVGAFMGRVNKDKLEEYKYHAGGTPSTPGILPPTMPGENAFQFAVTDPYAKGARFREQHHQQKSTITQQSEEEPVNICPDTLPPPFQRRTTQTSSAQVPYHKESVATMGWKVIKATVSGISIMKQLVPHDDTIDPIPDSVFESGIDHSDSGLIMKNASAQELKKPTIDIKPEKIEEEPLDEEPLEDHEPIFDEPPEDEKLPVVLEPPKKPSIPRKVSISYPTEPPRTDRRPTELPPPRNKLYRIVSQVFNRQDKRYPGLGFVQRCMGRARKSRVDSQVKLQLDNWEDHRPFFTWWVSSVQVMVLLVALMEFKFAEFGLEDHKISQQVQYRFTEKTIHLTKQRNFYFGPKTDALIRLGAKYAPCMRRDKKLFDIIECEWQKEERTSCCIMKQFCLQAEERDCSYSVYSYQSYDNYNEDPMNKDTRYQGWTSGAVCGLDPKYCDETHIDTSMLRNSFNGVPDWNPPAGEEQTVKINNWPMCSMNQTEMEAYGRKQGSEPTPWISCKKIAHPCCIGTEGRCEIVSPEYCEAMQGEIHLEAALCSQVDCLRDSCGMIPFIDPFIPNQFYRLYLSLFLHAGILHLCLTLFFQMVVLRDLEKLAGWWRIGIIYILSGIIGNLASAIFVPYKPDVGPSGAQYGLIACLFVEFIQSWQLLDQPWYAVLKLAVIAIFLFLFGLLPWVDNYAHLFGFISGILLSFALLPYIVFGQFDQGRKMLQALISITLWVLMAVGLLVIFYNEDPWYVPNASVISCISLLGDDQNFCKEHANEPVRASEFWRKHNQSHWETNRTCEYNENI